MFNRKYVANNRQADGISNLNDNDVDTTSNIFNKYIDISTKMKNMSSSAI